MSSEIVHYKVQNEATRFVKEEITESMTIVHNDRPSLPEGFRVLFTWAPILNGAMDSVLYPAIGRRENIRPKVTLLREYKVLSREGGDPLRYVLDRYARIGKHYVSCRVYQGEYRQEECVIHMYLTDEQKESIVAAAIHPTRLKKWLENGWEDYVYDHF